MWKDWDRLIWHENNSQMKVKLIFGHEAMHLWRWVIDLKYGKEGGRWCTKSGRGMNGCSLWWSWVIDLKYGEEGGRWCTKSGGGMNGCSLWWSIRASYESFSQHVALGRWWNPSKNLVWSMEWTLSFVRIFFYK